jgi:Ssp1 endopeptidase immunity protein Rap1a
MMLDEAAVTSGRVAAPTSSICVPTLAITDQLVEVGLRYWNAANSETRSMRAAQLLAEAWLEEWPCKRQP